MTDARQFGRVAEDGTVYVRTSAGERVVGQWADGDADAALAFFVRRYEGLVVEVDLLRQRIEAGTLSPADAEATLEATRAHLADASAVGDLDALAARVDALAPLIDAQRERRRAERVSRMAAATAAKEQIALQAEKVAAGGDWRHGQDRMHELLSEWKALPRIERSRDDELWHRLSTARTAYTRRRRAHFGEVAEQRGAARAAKEQLVKEAEALADSTEWGPTARAFRDLMARWRTAGSAGKGVDDHLWGRFRSAQDTFFGARDQATARIADEYAANAERKRAILAEAERLVPVTDPRSARAAFRALADRWDAAGKVPRGDIKELEERFRSVEQQIRAQQDSAGHRSNPEGYARAGRAVADLESALAALQRNLDEAVAAGDEAQATRTRADIDARQSWLEQARRTLADLR